MNLNNRVANCAECDFMKKYDYGNKIYYCDHEDRIDDIGKLGVDHPPKTSPEWCPLRENNGDPDLPSAPRLEIYQETFGDIKNITNEWYENNE